MVQVSSCSASKKRTLGVVGERKFRCEAPGELAAIASCIQRAPLDREVPIDYAKDRQKCLCAVGDRKPFINLSSSRIDWWQVAA
jgi:hypothetical protein